MSALATIVGGMGELSESELRQLYLMIGVRLGIPDAPPGSKTPGKGSGKTGNAKSSSGGKSSQKKNANASSKGNPSRKSQWANHPLYIEYARLKKVVETQAKESKLSFNAVDTAESRAYRTAFNQWLEAKSSFRGHGESGQDRVKPGEKKNDSEDESDEEEEEEEPAKAGPSKQPSPPRGQENPALTSAHALAGARKPSSPPSKGKAGSK